MKFKIDYSEYDIERVCIYRKLAWYRKWERISEVKTMEEARTRIELLKSLPEYH